MKNKKNYPVIPKEISIIPHVSTNMYKPGTTYQFREKKTAEIFLMTLVKLKSAGV